MLNSIMYMTVIIGIIISIIECFTIHEINVHCKKRNIKIYTKVLIGLGLFVSLLGLYGLYVLFNTPKCHPRFAFG